MAREDWVSVTVRKDLVKLSEQAAEKLHFPNYTQYINDAVRDRLKADGLLTEGGAE